MQALHNDFPGWQFIDGSGSPLNGTLDITSYDATADASSGGASLQATYAPGAGDPALANLEWIQIIYTSAPMGGIPVPYVDPYPNDDNLPFYFTSTEDQQFKAGGSYGFTDSPSRPYPTPPVPPQMISGLSWGADLLLASWNGITDPEGLGTVTLYGGISWSWYIEQYPKAGGAVTRGVVEKDKALRQTAVPEPASFVSLSIGIGLMVLYSFHRRLRGGAAKIGATPRSRAYRRGLSS